MELNKENKYTNNINEILNNSHSKIFFLKSILLGINYGQGENSELYKKTIEKELFELINNNKIIITENNISKKDKIQTPDKSLENKIIEYNNKLIHLNNEKRNIMSYILHLSKNYAFNNKKIIILKNSLLLLNKDIYKITKLLEKYNKEYQNNEQYNISISDSTLDNELEKTLENLSNLMI
jgi:hypothetical protein